MLSCKFDAVFRSLTISAGHLLKQQFGLVGRSNSFNNFRWIDSSAGEEIDSLVVVIQSMQNSVQRQILEGHECRDKVSGRLIYHSDQRGSAAQIQDSRSESRTYGCPEASNTTE